MIANKSTTDTSSKRVVKAKYRLNNNVFVNCFLTTLEVTPESLRAIVSVKKEADTTLPVGTKIFLNTDVINKQNGAYNELCTQVQSVEGTAQDSVHICTPIHHQAYQDQRKTPRLKVDFPVLLADSQTLFKAINGCSEGLGLLYIAQKAMLKLTVNQKFQFKVNYKGEDCALEGVIRHIHYDWCTFQHQVGIHFPDLERDKQIILNLMIDPNYKVQISDSQTVDTTQGKISL